MMRASREHAPTPGTSPKFASRRPNCADCAAKRISHDSANWKPAPADGPLIAAMIGFSTISRSSKKPVRIRVCARKAGVVHSRSR